MSARAKTKKCQGVVVDGRIRDLAEHRTMQFPVSVKKNIVTSFRFTRLSDFVGFNRQLRYLRKHILSYHKDRSYDHRRSMYLSQCLLVQWRSDLAISLLATWTVLYASRGNK